MSKIRSGHGPLSEGRARASETASGGLLPPKELRSGRGTELRKATRAAGPERVESELSHSQTHGIRDLGHHGIGGCNSVDRRVACNRQMQRIQGAKGMFRIARNEMDRIVETRVIDSNGVSLSLNRACERVARRRAGSRTSQRRLG